MIKVRVFLLKSFGVNQLGGNPAGVVLGSEGLTDDQRKSISKKIGYSETAFVERSDRADYKVRFFTPTGEVDLCGHATVATYSLLFQKSLITAGNYHQELNAGVLGIEIRSDGLVVMEQTLPQFSEFIEQSAINDIFGKSIIVNDLLPQIVSTGLRDIMLPVATRGQLFTLKPNLKKMSELNSRTNSIGIHAFTLETLDPNSVAHCRNFAPLYGIAEESATGSSNGALACYLYKHGKLTDRILQNMKFEQGYSMNEPSEMFVSLDVNKNQISRVRVAGRAFLFEKKEIEI